MISSLIISVTIFASGKKKVTVVFATVYVATQQLTDPGLLAR
jgi:hypothetical protein